MLVDELVDGAKGAALPLIRHDLDLSYGQVGLLASVPLLVGGFLELPLGVLAGQGRRRRLAILGGRAGVEVRIASPPAYSLQEGHGAVLTDAAPRPPECYDPRTPPYRDELGVHLFDHRTVRGLLRNPQRVTSDVTEMLTPGLRDRLHPVSSFVSFVNVLLRMMRFAKLPTRALSAWAKLLAPPTRCVPCPMRRRSIF